MIKQLKKRLSKFMFLCPRVLLVLLLLSCITLVILNSFDRFEPYLQPLHAARMRQRLVSPNLTIGPYPHEQEMQRLKQEGYTVLISLLDTRLPQEKALLTLERSTADRMGMTLINIPIGYLPLESPENSAAANMIGRKIAGLRGSRFYLHSYLGSRRVDYVRNKLVAEGVLKGK